MRPATVASAVLLGAVVGLGLATPAASQDALKRTPNLAGLWVGVPWTIHTRLPHRFLDAQPGSGVDLVNTTTFVHALGLPFNTLAGVAWAVSSPTVPDEPDEVQLYARHRLMEQGSAPLDLAVTGAWNTAAGSFDAEALVARRLGRVRLLGGARWLSDARGDGDGRAALTGGVVLNPLPRSAPISVSGDVATPVDREENEKVAWSAAVAAGVPHTAFTLSLQATNTAAASLQGATFGTDDTRYGFELTLPVPIGFFLGTYSARETARKAVVAEPSEEADAVVVIERYEYGPLRVVVDAGSVVEWVNRDEVVHTATAEDAAWDSGGILPGASWRARFDQAGTYPFYCGPHPFMKGVVIVR